jgi:hypothetical protein
MDGIEASGDSITEHIEELLKGCPTNIKQGNFGRWGTISFCAKMYSRIGCPCITWHAPSKMWRGRKVEAPRISTSIASELIKLMSSKANPNQESPTHYVSLQWLVGFGALFFEGNLVWAKRSDRFWSRYLRPDLEVSTGASLGYGAATEQTTKRWMEIDAIVCRFCTGNERS